jgi:hypothetical protein
MRYPNDGIDRAMLFEFRHRSPGVLH